MKQVLFAGDRLFLKFADFGYFRRRLGDLGAEVLRAEEMTDDGLADAFRTVDVAAVIAHPMTKDVIDTMEGCRLILTLSVGYDSVDVPAATARGIPVCNTPSYCTDDVATHAMTLLLSVARKIHLALPRTREALWGYEFAKPILAVSGRRLGIVGLGRVGRALVPKARAFGMEIAGYDPYLDDDVFEAFGVDRYYELSDLLSESDYVSVHAPLTDETRHMFDASALGTMKKEAVLVNTARGGLVDGAALAAALNRGVIAGAGIDVLEHEPPTTDDPLVSCDKALVTPHIAWYSEESHRRNQVMALDEIERVFAGHRPRHIVNPEVLRRA